MRQRTVHVLCFSVIACCCLAHAGPVPVADVITPVCGDGLDLAILPTPKQATFSGMAFPIGRAVIAPQAPQVAALAVDELRRALADAPGAGAACRFTFAAAPGNAAWGRAPDQGYRLTIGPGDGGALVNIQASGAAGFQHAVMTLRQLLHRKDGKLYVRGARIEDWPSIPWRGLKPWRGLGGRGQPTDVATATFYAPYKMNLYWQRYDAERWPPEIDEEEQEQEAALRQSIAGLQEQIKGIKAPAKADALAELEDDLDLDVGEEKAGDGLAAKEVERLLRQLREQSAAVEKQLAELVGKRDRMLAAGAKAKQELAAALRARGIGLVVSALAGEALDATPKGLARITSTFEAWRQAGVRRFVYNFDRMGYTLGRESPYKSYASAQAHAVGDVQRWFERSARDSRLHLWHQRCWGNPSADETLRQVAAAGLPKALALCWIGSQIHTPPLLASDFRTYQANFGGNSPDFLLHIWPPRVPSTGVALGPVPPHSADAVAAIDTYVMWQQQSHRAWQLAFLTALDWAWNAKDYDPARSMKLAAREWARAYGGKDKARCYQALAAVMEWARTHSATEIAPDQYTMDANVLRQRVEAEDKLFTECLATLKETLTDKLLYDEIQRPTQARLKEFRKIAEMRSRFAGDPVDKKRGYVVFTRPLFQYARPDEPPQPEWRSDRLTIVGAPTQIVPAKFYIHALRPFANVRLESFPLAGANGEIGRDNVEVHILRWLPKKREGRMSPEIYVKDDREQLKGVFLDTGLWPKVRLDGPVTTQLETNRTKEFWVQVRLPASTAPGQYAGVVTVTLDDQALRLPLELEVFPIKLEKPDEMLWGIWHPQAWSTEKSWDELTNEEKKKRPMTRKVFARYLKALADHGFSTFTPPGWDDPRFLEVGTMMRELGMTPTYTFNGGLTWAYRDDGEPEAHRYTSRFLKRSFSLTEYMQAGTQFARKHDLPLPVMTMEDEVTSTDVVRRRTKMAKAGGGHTWSCIHKNWRNMAKVLSFPIQNGGINRENSEYVHQQGHFALGYNQSYTSLFAGRGERGKYGIGAWNSAADGYLPYTAFRAFGDPFDETDGRFADYMTIYPSLDGPLISPRYMGHRLAVDDYRYVYTLHLLLAKREREYADNIDKMNALALFRAEADHFVQRAPLDHTTHRRLAAFIERARTL